MAANRSSLRQRTTRQRSTSPAIVLASGEATEGYEVFLQRRPEGSGPLPHSHPWDESFFVIKGQGASKMFIDFAREVAPVNADLQKLAEIGARHGAKLPV